MPPTAQLAQHLTAAELKANYLTADDHVEARRWHLIYLISTKCTIKRAAEVVCLNYDYAKEIVRKYNAGGPLAIRNLRKHRHNRPVRTLLTPEQQQELRQLLQHPAPDGESWTGKKVAQWIADKTGRQQVWPQRGWEYLKRLQQES